MENDTLSTSFNSTENGYNTIDSGSSIDNGLLESIQNVFAMIYVVLYGLALICISIYAIYKENKEIYKEKTENQNNKGTLKFALFLFAT